MAKGCKGTHWWVWADDSGDCGVSPRSSPAFGYAAVALDRAAGPAFNQMRGVLRSRLQHFGEMKPRVTSPLALDLSRSLVEFAAIERQFFAAACMVTKEHYDGPYLRPWNQKPRNTTWFRHYILRHTLELLFADRSVGTDDHLDIFIDRDTWVDARRLDNLKDYLNGRYSTLRAHPFPRVDYIAAVDSHALEGLQVADHLARMAMHMRAEHADLPAVTSAADVLRVSTILRGRDFVVPAGLLEELHHEGRTAPGG